MTDEQQSFLDFVRNGMPINQAAVLSRVPPHIVYGWIDVNLRKDYQEITRELKGKYLEFVKSGLE